MKLIQNQPAASWTQAFPVGNREMVCRVYGRPGEERIDLAEKRFLALRDGKISRGKTSVGHLLIHNCGEEQTEEYRRELDLKAGTALAQWRSCLLYTSMQGDRDWGKGIPEPEISD